MNDNITNINNVPGQNLGPSGPPPEQPQTLPYEVEAELKATLRLHDAAIALHAVVDRDPKHPQLQVAFQELKDALEEFRPHRGTLDEYVEEHTKRSQPAPASPGGTFDADKTQRLGDQGPETT